LVSLKCGVVELQQPKNLSIYPFRDSAQTAPFKAPVRKAL